MLTQVAEVKHELTCCVTFDPNSPRTKFVANTFADSHLFVIVSRSSVHDADNTESLYWDKSGDLSERICAFPDIGHCGRRAPAASFSERNDQHYPRGGLD